MERSMVQIGSHVHLEGDFDLAVERVTAALKVEGFGVLTEIDVKETFKKKLGVDFRRYKILGACNPPFAHKALTLEPEVGLLLPCNVTVAEAPGGGVDVALVDPLAMLGVIPNPALAPVAQEVSTRLQRVAAALRS